MSDVREARVEIAARMTRRKILLCTLILTANCASSEIPPVPQPPQEPEVFIVPNTLEPDLRVCIQRAWGDGSRIDNWDCVTVADLRAWARYLQRTNN